MKISIITVVYNAERTIKSCVDSVLSQDYPDVEYIVIDGNSADHTVELVKSYDSSRIRLISEPDKGIYDAMNKGIALATGDVVGILNADDTYSDSSVLSEIAALFGNSKVNAVYADLEYVDAVKTDKVVRKWKAGHYQSGMFLLGWMPPHPTFFVRREFYDRLGKFRLDMGSAADYELMLRFIHKNRLQLSYLPREIVKMRAGGASNSSLSARLTANKMDAKAWKVNDLKPYWYTVWLKPIRKIVQFF